ncbi:MAG: hypothetical protein ABW063_03060 [Caulobacter sp.]
MRAAALFTAFALSTLAAGAATASDKADKPVKTVSFTVRSVEYYNGAVILNSEQDYRASFNNQAVFIERDVAARP